MQYVSLKFNGTERLYSYQWPGEAELKEGDRVVVPANWTNPMPSFATVVHVFEDRDAVPFRGPLAEVMGLVNEA